jgi:hypothetical protein
MSTNEIPLVTPGQIKCIAINIKRRNMRKEDVISGASAGRTEHISELYLREGIELIKYLKKQDPDEIKAEKMRRKIISMAHEVGYRKPGTKQVDMKKVDSWCTQYGYMHKKLNQYNLHELPGLVTQFELYYKSYLNSI